MGTGGHKESSGRGPQEEAEPTGEIRWDETLEVKVTEFSRKGSGWEGLTGGLGAKGGAQVGGISGAFWETLSNVLGGDLKATAWSSGRLREAFGVL